VPELPDVELYRRRLELGALSRPIARVEVADPRSLQHLTPADLAVRLAGARLAATRRHGKHLFAALSGGGWLTFHFGMNGVLQCLDGGEAVPRYLKVRVVFEDGGTVVFADKRVLGRVGLTADVDAFVREAGLGPDALDDGFEAAALAAALARRRVAVKAVLMDQAVTAGIGNIYADEILFQARLHPLTVAATLDLGAARELHGAMRRALGEAIACGAGSEQYLERLPAYCLLPQRHRGGHCPRCTARLGTFKLGGRTGYACARCQPRGD